MRIGPNIHGLRAGRIRLSASKLKDSRNLYSLSCINNKYNLRCASYAAVSRKLGLFPYFLRVESPVHVTVPLKPEETVTEGETVVLHAEVSKPDVPGTWFKDDLEIIPKVDKKYDAAVSGTVHELTIHDAAKDDQAEYTLEIGEESTTAVLKVQGIKRHYCHNIFLTLILRSHKIPIHYQLVCSASVACLIEK